MPRETGRRKTSRNYHNELVMTVPAGLLNGWKPSSLTDLSWGGDYEHKFSDRFAGKIYRSRE